MKKIITKMGIMSFLLMLGSCFQGGKQDENVIDGGHGIGIDTATINMQDVPDKLDSIIAAGIIKDEPAPEDKLHTISYITEKVKSFYESMDDKKACSTNYLELLALTEKVAKSEGKNLREDDDLLENHWTVGDTEDAHNKDWSYEILGVRKITKYSAIVLVNVKMYYETKMKIHLVLENDDWRADNFEMVSQVSFDATVQVYEEHPVYYNEKEMMANYIRSVYGLEEEYDEEEDEEEDYEN